MNSAPEFDVFLSYAHLNKDVAEPVLHALERANLRVWIDRSKVRTFASISRALQEGLGRSKCLLAIYSTDYPGRRICQWELTAAFLAGQHEGDPRKRVIVVNPAGSPDHIHPIELRDELYLVITSTTDAATLAEMADAVATHTSAITTPIGQIQALARPQWYPTATPGWPRFVGRLKELWEIHSTLQASQHVGIHGASRPDVAQVRGFGGIGKTLLAEEYALRFGSAYPGGVFWFRAPRDPRPELQRASRGEQLTRIAERLGMSTHGLTADQVTARISSNLESTGQRCLWVVDNLPIGVSHDCFRDWLPPHPLCHTLITTRSRALPAGYHPVELDVLPAQAAFELLSEHIEVAGDQENAARALLADLGHHALACEVVGAWARIASIPSVAEALAQQDSDALSEAARFSDTLPHAQQANVTALILSSIRGLPDPAQEVLCIGSALAPGIPVAPKLVVLIHERLGGSESDANLGIRELELRSLIRRTESHAWEVHAIISHAVKHSALATRLPSFRDAATSVLASHLEIGRLDVHSTPAAHVVAHARHLSGEPTTAAEALLLGRVARYDSETGAYDSSRHLREKCLCVQEILLGPEDPETLRSRHELGSVLSETGENTPAELLLRDTLLKRIRSLGPDHADTLSTFSVLATTVARSGRAEEALAIEFVILEARSRTLGPFHYSTLTTLSNIGESLLSLRRIDEAIVHLENLVEILDTQFPPDDPQTLTPKFNLAGAYIAKRRFEDATCLLEHVARVRSEVLGPDHPHTVLATQALDLLAKTRSALPSRPPSRGR